MKTIIKITSLILIIFLLNIQNINAQCHQDDWTALKALYESTDGDNWTDRTGWAVMINNQDSPPVNCNLEDLFGIDLDISGRVSCLDLDGVHDCGSSNSVGNNLAGTIPQELSLLTNLTYLNFSNYKDTITNNQLSGNIPAELGGLIRLTDLKISNNLLNGNIPPELDNLFNLKVLALNGNGLSGGIPAELGNLSRLEVLALDDNLLTGLIPGNLSNLFNLNVLTLKSNGLIGAIPPQLGDLNNLKNLTLSFNLLDGSIPPELGNLNNLYWLSLDNNILNGSIPPELSNLTILKTLNLSENDLTGNIPAELGSLNNLNTLRLDNNLLSGCYDADLLSLCELVPFWVSNGYISGGNNFDASFEDFCATNNGACPLGSSVYPGDKNNDGIVDQKDVSIIGFLYETGPPRAPEHQNTDWYGHPCEDWDDNLPFNGANIKHLDCNGDGTISTADANAVLDNLGFTHDEGGQQIGTFVFPETNYQIYLQPVDDLDNDNLLEVNVVLESKNGNNLNLQGGYFTIDYNNVNTNITNAAMNFTNSWLGSPNINMIESFTNFPNTNQIEIGFSKTNGTNSTGKGIIGQLTFVLDNNAMRTANGLLDFEVIEIGVHDSQGNIQPIEEQLLQVGLNESNCQTNWTITEDSPFYNVYKSNGTIATDGFVLVGKEQQVQYSANRVSLEEGFSVRAGANFKVRSNDCN